MSADPRYIQGGRPASAPAAAPRYFLHPSYVRAIAPAARGRLVNVLNALMMLASEVDGRLIVRAPRSEVAELAGVHEDTIKRAERELQGLGIVRHLAHGAASRDVEILPPPTVPIRPIRDHAPNGQGRTGAPLNSAMVAIRAVDNSVPELRQGCTGAPLEGGMGAPLARASESLRERELKSRFARVSGDCGKLQAPETRRDPIREAASELGTQAQERLGREGSGPEHTLTPRQGAKVRDAIGRRLATMVGAGAGSAAIAQAQELIRQDLERVLDYSLRAARPAAHLATALGRSWHAHPWPGSTAEGVAARGREAERPVQDLDSRSGPAFRAGCAIDPEDGAEAPGDLERALARYGRAVRNTPNLRPDQRSRLQAFRPVSADEALDLAVQLERVTVLASVQPRENL